MESSELSQCVEVEALYSISQLTRCPWPGAAGDSCGWVAHQHWEQQQGREVRRGQEPLGVCLLHEREAVQARRGHAGRQDVRAGRGGGLGQVPRHHRELRPHLGHLDGGGGHALLSLLALLRGSHYQEGSGEGESLEIEANLHVTFISRIVLHYYRHCYCIFSPLNLNCTCYQYLLMCSAWYM